MTTTMLTRARLRRRLAVAATIGTFTAASLGLAATAAASRMNSDELLEFCRIGKGTFVETPKSYNCLLPSGTLIHCEANMDKECDVTAPPGVSDPIPGGRSQARGKAPDEPGRRLARSSNPVRVMRADVTAL